MTCERCGAIVKRLVLKRTQLWCGACCLAEQATIQAPGVIRDEIPGGFTQENFGVQPETFYSWSAMRKRADALGLQPFVRQLETIRESDYIDAQTLENARILVSRGSRATHERDPARLETVQTAVKDWTW